MVAQAAPLSGTRGCFETLDGEGHHDQGLHQVHEAAGVVGQVVEVELVAVGDGVFEACEGGVVELLHVGHGRGEALGVALGFGGQGPVGVGLEVGRAQLAAASRCSLT